MAREVMNRLRREGEPHMNDYDTDIVAWSEEQAALLRR
jgi:hypothetical protein